MCWTMHYYIPEFVDNVTFFFVHAPPYFVVWRMYSIVMGFNPDYYFDKYFWVIEKA